MSLAVAAFLLSSTSHGSYRQFFFFPPLVPLAAEATAGQVCTYSGHPHIHACMCINLQTYPPLAYMDDACCFRGHRCNFPFVTRRVAPNIAGPCKTQSRAPAQREAADSID